MAAETGRVTFDTDTSPKESQKSLEICTSSLGSLKSAPSTPCKCAPQRSSTAAHELVYPIGIEGRHFKDEFGRTLLLRGVNMSGNSKLPVSPQGVSSHCSPHFYDHKNVSFVGRPFRIKEADEHFLRLRSWGLTFVRLLVPWEALEHEGPGIYGNDVLIQTRST
jgi:hypothetical protein